MRFKTLLLGSAAAFAFAGGSAQAADLSVAEPVDYVRVCDAFGVGYWYIPGTDQCIAISGKVKFQAGWVEDGYSYGLDDNGTPDNPDDDFQKDADWYFLTGADFNVDVRSITDWGPLVAYVAFTADSDESQFDSDNAGNFHDDNRIVYLDEAFLSLGPLTLGYTGSVFDVAGGGYTDIDFDLSDSTIDQIQLSWAFNGFGIALGIEDPRDRWGSDESMDMPDLTGALSFGFGGMDAALAVLYSDTSAGNYWAVEGSLEAEFGIWQFQLGAIYGDGGPGGQPDGLLTGDGYAAFFSSQQNWASNFYTAETVAYDDPSNTWGAAFMAAYSPVDTLWLSLNVGTGDWDNGPWEVYFLAEKTFGPNG